MATRRNPPQRKHPIHTFAAPDERWEAFGKVCEQLGTDRSKLLNLCMAWYTREDGAVLPRRPLMPPPSDASA